MDMIAASSPSLLFSECPYFNSRGAEVRLNTPHKVRLCNGECHYLSALDVRGGDRKKKKRKKSPEIVNLSSGYSRPFMKCRENYLVFKTCMFFHVCLPASVRGKNNTWDVFDFDTLKTSA